MGMDFWSILVNSRNFNFGLKYRFCANLNDIGSVVPLPSFDPPKNENNHNDINIVYKSQNRRPESSGTQTNSYDIFNKDIYAGK